MGAATSTKIPFTQYILPDGRKKATECDVPQGIAEMANAILAQGHYRFECEILTTGEVSLTTFDTENEIDIAIEICPNGPQVPRAVANMIAAAWAYILNPPKPEGDDEEGNEADGR